MASPYNDIRHLYAPSRMPTGYENARRHKRTIKWPAKLLQMRFKTHLIIV